MNNEKDYSLLRPFDLEAAKRGEAITSIVGYDGKPVWEYVAGPDSSGLFILKVIKSDIFTSPCVTEKLRMVPICWVEGKPVYKGDSLWHATAVKVTASHNLWDNPEGFICTDGDYVCAESLSWAPHKAKKREGWMNVYKDTSIRVIYDSIEEADFNASKNRVKCVHVTWSE